MKEAKINLSNEVISGIVKKLEGIPLNKWEIKHPDCSSITSVELPCGFIPEMKLRIKITKGGSWIEVEMRENDGCWEIQGTGETYLSSSDPSYKFFSQIFREVIESYEKTRREKEIRVNERLADALK